MRLLGRASLLVAVALLQVTSVQAQVRLEQKLIPGQTVKSKDVMSTVQTLKIADQSIDTKSSTTLQTSLSVKDGGGGLLKVGYGIDAILSRIELPGNRIIVFDSTKPANVEDTDAVSASIREIYTGMVGAKIDATIVGGKVAVVEGVTEKMPITADEVKTELQQRLNQTPDQPVKPGDTWERTEELHIGVGQTLTFQRRYKYVGTMRANTTDTASKELDEIQAVDMSVLYAARQSPQFPLTVKRSDLKIESSEHTMLFDRELGRVVKSDNKSHIVGDIEFGIAGQDLGGSLDLQLESHGEEIK